MYLSCFCEVFWYHIQVGIFRKRETYAIVASIKHMRYILKGKYFIIEIDNKNTTYMRIHRVLQLDGIIIFNHLLYKIYSRQSIILVIGSQGRIIASIWIPHDDSNANLTLRNATRRLYFTDTTPTCKFSGRRDYRAASWDIRGGWGS
jgi:hypothetical protein